MDTVLIGNIVDMAKMTSLYPDNVSLEYGFKNGTKMVVSRNAMTPGGKSGLLAVLPYDKAGNQLDERAEGWLIAEEVAQKMVILASE